MGFAQTDIIDINRMGLESQNYQHCFKTGTISSCQNYEQFQQDFLSSLDARCDLFICNIFNPQALQQNQVELDKCFIPTYETFTHKQLPHICPLLDDHLLFDDQLANRQQKLRFIIDYCIYLGLKRVSIRLNIKERHSILNSIENIAKYIRKAKIAIIVIVDCSRQEDLSWESYVQLRRCLKGDTCLQLCLQIGANVPGKEIIERWYGENVAYLSLRQDAFILNNKGYPVLSTAHQLLIKDFIKKHVNLFVSFQTPLALNQKQPYFKYLAFVLQKVVSSMTKREVAAQALLDYLQAPLQPYIDNLDGQTYDIFESDHHKYDQYEIALTEALKTFNQGRPCVTYYVGAGKGLILNSLINATKKAGKKVKVYCIQKNPFPIQTLKRRISKNKWGKFVEIVQTDIKKYVMPEKPDLIFSQLLGGLGDNQLSPECLRWAQKNATETTRFVPQKYTSYIRPISCHKLYQQLDKQERECYFTVKSGLYYSPFNSKPIWYFQHPLPSDDSLQRSVKVQWLITRKMAIHGFQGSFDCNLFSNSFLTIVPQANNIDSYSWFPLFFSFKEQQLAQSGDKITIEIQRKSTEKQVWYQWRYQIQDHQGNVRRDSTWHNENARFAIHLQEE